jgi:predicted phosphoribosyltransferase
MRFRHRVEAGRLLAEALEPYRGKAPVVFALPRGGVVLGAEIARLLGAPLDLIVVRKVGHPEQPEYAIAAVAEDGHLIGNDQEIAGLEEGVFRRSVEAAQAEARRRRLAYLARRSSPDASGRTAILVDDGLATGLTMEVAIEEVRHRKPETIVLAVPVAPDETLRRLARKVDAVVALHVPRHFLGAVGVYYDDFSEVSDEEVRALLQAAP